MSQMKTYKSIFTKPQTKDSHKDILIASLGTHH